MAYKNTELIKKFNVVRDYIRDFFLYGYKKRGDFEEKSKRTYEEHYRQIRSWLKEYMYTRQSASGKAQMISVDSREVIHNPLYKAFKTRSFTDLDLLLHFSFWIFCLKRKIYRFLIWQRSCREDILMQ